MLELPSSNGDLPESPEGDEQDAIDEREGYESGGDNGTNVEVILVQDADSGSKERQENQHLHDVDVVLPVRLDKAEDTQAQHYQQAVDELKKRFFGGEGEGSEIDKGLCG